MKASDQETLEALVSAVAYVTKLVNHGRYWLFPEVNTVSTNVRYGRSTGVCHRPYTTRKISHRGVPDTM